MDVGTRIPCARTTGEALGALSQLEEFVHNVLIKLRNNMESKREQLRSLDVRITAAKQKVTVVAANKNKAITVFSAARYPVDELPLQKSIVDDILSVQLTPMPSISVDRRRTSLPYSEGISDLVQKLRIRCSDVCSRGKEELEDTKPIGLGDVPRNIQSIDSMLLFNTTMNPYEVDYLNDPFEAPGQYYTSEQEEKASITAAPQTMVDGDILPRLSSGDMSFKPVLGNVPQFDLPDVLPDLPGVADIDWSMSPRNFTIAPSKGFDELIPKEVTSRMPSSAKVVQSKEEIDEPPLKSPPQREKVIPIAPKATAAPPPPPAAPPPPPPPPVAPIAPPVAVTKRNVSSSNPKADLLAAIRNPNVKLRKVANAFEVSKKSRKKSIAEGNDMMSQLKSRMKLRHVAISGRDMDDEEKENDWSE